MHEEFDRKSTNNIKASNEKKSRFEYNNVLPINQTFGFHNLVQSKKQIQNDEKNQKQKFYS